MKRFLILCGLAACAAAGAANWELLSAGSRGDARVIPSPDGFSIELVNADGVNNYATVMCNPEAVPAEGKQMNFTLKERRERQGRPDSVRPDRARRQVDGP